MGTLTLSALKSAVDGAGVAFRVRQQLQPAGGPGDKVFPPTYATGDNRLKYAGETRRINGQDVPCVLLDSVASQANRMEEALLTAWEQGALDFPVIGVDFRADDELRDLGAIAADGLFQGLCFAADLLASNAGDFGFKQGSNVGHGPIVPILSKVPTKAR